MSSNMTTGQALGYVAGAVIGYFTFGASYVVMGAALGGMVGGLADPPKGPSTSATGPRLSDLSVQTSTYGTAIPHLYGTAAVHGNIFWLENNALKEVATTTTQESGGKGGGGGSKSTQTSYAYFATFALGLCRGPITGVRRIWCGPNLIYDAGSSSMVDMLASNNTQKLFTLYTGDDTQLPDPRMQATLGIANTPAYRGLAYLVFNDFALKDYANSLVGAQFKVEIVADGHVDNYVGSNISMPMTNYFNSVASKGAGFAAAGDSRDIYYTPNGENWFKAIVGGVSPRLSNKMAANNQKYVMAGYNGFVYVSESGEYWSQTPVGIGNQIIIGICWDGRRWLAWNENAAMAVSSDAEEWKPQASYFIHRVTAHTAVGNGNGIALATDHHSDCRYTRYDADSEIAEVLYFPFLPVFLISWGSGFAILNATNIALSTDGRGWVTKTAPYATPISFSWDGDNFYISNYDRLHAAISPDADTWTTFSTAARGGWNNSVSNGASILLITSDEHNFGLIRKRIVTPDAVPLGDIVAAECLASGLLTLSDIDTTSLTDVVRGYTVAQPGPLRKNIEPLQAAWPFDAIQSGYKIKFIRRGTTGSVITVPETDLDARSAGTAAGKALIVSREMSSMLPALVSISYADVDREYEPGEQLAERTNSQSTNETRLELAISMTADNAAQVADVLLWHYWLERYDVSLKLPPSYSALEPADVFTVTTKNGTYTLRAAAIQYQADGCLELSCKYANNAVYTSPAKGSAGASLGATGVSGLTEPGTYELLDLPVVIDTLMDMPGYVSAMSGFSAGWPGGEIIRSNDAGQTWALAAAYDHSAKIGRAMNVLAAVDTLLIDKASVLQVTLFTGELASVTEAQMLNGANYFCYGANSRWEIIAAQTCALQGDGTYLLSDLLRGRCGTEWAMATHQAADRVIQLSLTDTKFVGASLDSIGKEQLYRGLSINQPLSEKNDKKFTYAGTNLECLAPVYLNGNRHPSTSDWSLTWLRRTRVGGEWRDYVDATLGEASESYEIEIYSSNTYGTLKRLLTSTTPAVAYTSAQQVTDFGSNQATLYIKIYQLSANVGRGYPLTTSITR